MHNIQQQSHVSLANKLRKAVNPVANLNWHSSDTFDLGSGDPFAILNVENDNEEYINNTTDNENVSVL